MGRHFYKFFVNAQTSFPEDECILGLKKLITHKLGRESSPIFLHPLPFRKREPFLFSLPSTILQHVSSIVASSLQVASRRVIRSPPTHGDRRHSRKIERREGEGRSIRWADVLRFRPRKHFPALSPRPRAIMFPSLIVQIVGNAVDPSAVCLSIDRSIESFGKDDRQRVERRGIVLLDGGRDCRVRVCVLTSLRPSDFNTIKAKHKALSVAF